MVLKDPDTGKRVARTSPPSERISKPETRHKVGVIRKTWRAKPESNQSSGRSDDCKTPDHGGARCPAGAYLWLSKLCRLCFRAGVSLRPVLDRQLRANASRGTFCTRRRNANAFLGAARIPDVRRGRHAIPILATPPIVLGPSLARRPHSII